MGSNELVQDPQKLLQLLLTAVFQVLSHAGAQVLVDQLPGKTVQGTSGGSGLHQNIRAVHVLFHHAPDAPDLTLDAVQPGDEVLVLLFGALLVAAAAAGASLSRGTAGIRGKTLIVNLPGSPKAVKESLEYVLPHLGHGLGILRGTDGECGNS